MSNAASISHSHPRHAASNIVEYCCRKPGLHSRSTAIQIIVHQCLNYSTFFKLLCYVLYAVHNYGTIIVPF